MKIISFIKNNKGNTFVEATIVFPLIIIAIITLIYIMTFLFDEVSSTGKMHMDLIKEAGESSATFYTSGGKYSSKEMYFGSSGVRKACFGEAYILFQERGLISDSFTKSVESRRYVIDEKSEIRIDSFIRDSLGIQK